MAEAQTKTKELPIVRRSFTDEQKLALLNEYTALNGARGLTREFMTRNRLSWNMLTRWKGQLHFKVGQSKKHRYTKADKIALGAEYRQLEYKEKKAWRDQHHVSERAVQYWVKLAKRYAKAKSVAVGDIPPSPIHSNVTTEDLLDIIKTRRDMHLELSNNIIQDFERLLGRRR